MPLGSRPSGGGNERSSGFFREQVDLVADYLRYQNRLNHKEKHGSTEAHLRKAAKGNTPGAVLARKILGEEPDLPEDFEFMVEWVYALHGRSGASMAGLLPLSYTTVEAWVKLMDIHYIEPYHIEALLVLDAAMLIDPSKPQKDSDFDADNEVEERVFASWPEKKK